MKEGSVLTRILLGALFIFSVAGCATTRNKTDDRDQIQARVVELEKKLEEKDSEIVDLQYELKDLSSKVEARPSQPAAPVVVENAAPPVVAANKGSDIIRAGASPEQLQSALQSAGVYTGKIDGKIGPGTKAAIVQFQKNQGLVPDGVVGRKTWDVLKKYLN